MNFAYYSILTMLLFVAILLILLILIQKGRGGGLSSAFGGSGGSTAFGAKTGDVLTWATSIIFGIFIFLAVILDLVVSSQYKSSAAVPASTPVIPPVTSSMPDNTTNSSPDTQPPPAAPTAAAPTPAAPTPMAIPAVPTTNPVGVVQRIIQNAGNQVKSTTQP